MHRSLKRGIALIILAAAFIVGLLFLPKQSKNVKHPPNDDPWLLVSYDPDNPYGTYLGNGFIGCRIMGEGVGNHNGDPLPCFMAGLYDNEKLVPTPTWSDLRFYDGNTEFKIDKKANYKQVLDMKTGILTTYATWRAGRKTLNGKIEVIVSRARQNTALIRATLMPDFNGRFSIKGGSNKSDTSLRYVGGAYMKMIYGAGDIILTEYATPQTGLAIGCATNTNSVGRAAKGKNLVINHFVSLVVEKKANQAGAKAVSLLNKAIAAKEILTLEHKRAMADLWKHDIIIDGPKKDQQALHSCMFYLLQSARKGSQWSIPPMGLSNNAFSGHVFWDADLWMFPAFYR